eukprot:c7119_g1_i1.p1 GENE.c7119_g1_i1~~c7119_g1_i1.p1  ORF type:complete len:378 (-),score=68.61 c7119_g1_i1:13-1110(-)
MSAAFLALFLASATSSCKNISTRESCVITDENGITCAWCFPRNHSSPAFCLDRPTAFRSTELWCDTADEEIPTRAQIIYRSTVPSNAPAANYVPVVFMHGLGDSGSNPGMQSIAKSVSSAYPGLYSIAVDVADGMKSYTTDIGKQVDEFAAAVRADPKLANGFTAVGLSQGGLIVRVYAQIYNDPPVHTLVSMCGPQEGVGDCPGGTPEFLCNLVREDLYGAPISFAGYWKNSLDQATYLSKSKWLATWNNDHDSKNQTYRENMLSLKRYVLVQALNDTVVKPHVSEDHGFFAWGSVTEINNFNQTEEYSGDWLGLKTLSQLGRVDHLSYIGEHLRWSQEFWTDSILPYFNSTFDAFEPAMLTKQ